MASIIAGGVYERRYFDGSVVIPNAVYVNVDIPTRVEGTHNAWVNGSGYNSGTGLYSINPGMLIPETGRYSLSASIRFTSFTSLVNKNFFLTVAINGVRPDGVILGRRITEASDNQKCVDGSLIGLPLTAGQFFSLQVYQDSGGTPSLNAVSFSIMKE
jgi:hypothetical protein